MNDYFVNYRALWVAENCTGTLHNLCPIRGAQLRDSSAWTDYILDAVTRFADRSDVVFQSHNWAHYNTPQKPNVVRDYLLDQAAIYKYLHDQTLLWANEGYTPKEIARKVHYPQALKLNWHARPYYGSLPLNARAVYTKYLGYYNGNPNDLDPLTEVEEARQLVEYAGSEEAVVERASKAYEAGDYRQAANAAGKVLLVNPQNDQARYLEADAFEQLGYAAESSIWRNAYLQGAHELRVGAKARANRRPWWDHDLVSCMSSELLLRYLGIFLDYEKTEGLAFRFALNVDEKTYGRAFTSHYVVELRGGVLLAARRDTAASEQRFANLTKGQLLLLVQRKLDVRGGDVSTNCPQYLEAIQNNLVDPSDFRDFSLVE